MHTVSRQLGRALVACALPIVLGACENSPEPALVPTTIAITPATAVSLSAIGASQQLTAGVKDQNGNTLAGASVSWGTNSAAVVTVNGTGLLTAVGNGSAQVTATSGTATAMVTVNVTQTSSQLVRVSGDSQTATAGQALAHPVVVRVNDANGHAVAGVSVSFAVTTGSGSVGSASATTNASGQAQTTWTLGATVGKQTATATVAGSGISGNPVVFTATSTTLPALSLTPVVSGLNTALYVTAPPGDTNRIFVVQQSGTIRVVRHDSLLTTPFLTVATSYDGGERGLLSMAFHPNYATNGYFYIDYTGVSGTLTIARYHVSADPSVADATSGQILLSIPHSTYANHNGGLVKFGPDGYLYIGTGDGGSGGDPDGHGQDSTQLLGKILRIDVNSGTLYGIPPSNPFANRPPAAPEVWAYGMRNPWRFSFDALTGDFYIGDVGQGAYEEIDFAPAADPGGHNYGWNTMEGLHCYSPASGCIMSGKMLPVYEYSHAGGNCSITGGYVYRGTRNPSLIERYVFADYCVGRVRSLKMVGGVATGAVEHTEFALLPNLTSFGEDGRGELYITQADGHVYRITPQ